MEWIMGRAQSLVERSVIFLIRKNIIQRQVLSELYSIPLFKRRASKTLDHLPSADGLLALLQEVCNHCLQLLFPC